MSQWDLQANETSVYFKNYVNDKVVEAECHEALMNEHIKCAEEHEQLAVWLKELKQLRAIRYREALEQESCEDVMAIHTQGLAEGIR